MMNSGHIKRVSKDIKRNVVKHRDKIIQAGAGLVLVAIIVALMMPHSSEMVIVQEPLGQDSAESIEQQDQSMAFVYMCGAVLNPGVYELPEGSRLSNALELAGGFTEDAKAEAVNLARVVEDGEQVYVPSKNEHAESNQEVQTVSGLLNINIASSSDLESLQGVGPSTAQKIIAFRSSNGPFKSIDDLLNVSGIGEKKLAGIRPYITVG